jgi:hypothetical protein
MTGRAIAHRCGAAYINPADEHGETRFGERRASWRTARVERVLLGGDEFRVE